MSEIEFYGQLIKLESSLKKFAYRLTQRKEDANDLFQETCLRVILNRGKYINDENFKAWTFTIMKNTFISEYRRSFRQRFYQDQNNDSFLKNMIEYSDGCGPDSEYSVLEITQSIERLENKFRIPFKMHIQGFKYHEIAEKMNLNLGTVKNRIFLSRKQLMVQIER